MENNKFFSIRTASILMLLASLAVSACSNVITGTTPTAPTTPGSTLPLPSETPQGGPTASPENLETPIATSTSEDPQEPTQTGPTEAPAPTETPKVVQGPSWIPRQEDWVDHGTIFEAGEPGEWDHILWGGFAFSVIKIDGTYFLYYQGSSEYSNEEETVMWRSIGVATSSDGIHFTKYANNPILTWFPNNSLEEGAVSSAVTVDNDGRIYLFYGANTEETSSTVNADARVAVSTDGILFTDNGLVLDHTDRSVWGSGDELFPVAVIQEQDQWIVYYIPNGTLQSGRLGVATGNQYNNLQQTSEVKAGRSGIKAWGTAGQVKLNSGDYALVINNVREKRTEIRQVSIMSPNILSEPITVYQYNETQQIALLYDEQKEIWFMYYRAHDDRYGVKTASQK
jgi:hypothetical protein